MSSPLRLPRIRSGGSGTRPVARELRRAPRRVLVLDVIFQLPEGEPVWAVSRDLSQGGIFVQTPAPPPVGVTVIATVLVPANGRAIRMEGVVRWASPEGMGIELLCLGAREAHELTELLGRV